MKSANALPHSCRSHKSGGALAEKMRCACCASGAVKRSSTSSINDLFRNEWHASGNLFARAIKRAVPEVFVGFLCLGGKYFGVFASKDSDFAFVGPFKSNVNAFRSVGNLSAVANGNDGNRHTEIQGSTIEISRSAKCRTFRVANVA